MVLRHVACIMYVNLLVHCLDSAPRGVGERFEETLLTCLLSFCPAPKENGTCCIRKLSTRRGRFPVKVRSIRARVAEGKALPLCATQLVSRGDELCLRAGDTGLRQEVQPGEHAPAQEGQAIQHCCPALLPARDNEHPAPGIDGHTHQSAREHHPVKLGEDGCTFGGVTSGKRT